ncbi:hypothetical protein [Marinobacterium lutimaris]|uniref:Uncharacterized protein n=1 Tax=Marinobacterium lutimaris TaxID=568106 RepID=A0A1H6BZW3_9GAMM|nr:hypothetical protein [Marinobacterium lutimaris]SEG65686.1 hypothetical protein SAMN05444390_10311 [Marinobacterium lutimaris]
MGALFQFPESREESQSVNAEQQAEGAVQAGSSSLTSVLNNRSADLELTAAKEVETWLSTWGTES